MLLRAARTTGGKAGSVVWAVLNLQAAGWTCTSCSPTSPASSNSYHANSQHLSSDQPQRQHDDSEMPASSSTSSAIPASRSNACISSCSIPGLQPSTVALCGPDQRTSSSGRHNIPTSSSQHLHKQHQQPGLIALRHQTQLWQWIKPVNARLAAAGALAAGSTAHVRTLSAAASAVSGDIYESLPASVRQDILESSQRKQNGVSMKYILDFGAQPLERQMLLSARFLKEELPVRLAHRIIELNALPPKLRSQTQIIKCRGWYADSFHIIRSFPPIKDHQDVVMFTNMLKHALRRHANVVPAIAKGVEQYKREMLHAKRLLIPGSAELPSDTADIQTFLDTFFMSRIAIRFLVGHHVALHEHAMRADHIGLVYTKCAPVHVAADAVADARAICFREYGDAPTVNVHGNPDLRFAYVPSHLHHMIFELVKNSLRAVQDRYSRGDDEAPAITVVIAEGVEDITIKVADQGGGIPRSGAQHIWTYLYTTAKSPLPDLQDDDDVSNLPAVLAGYGCGLPLSRLYARYFGGDLQIISMEGYGTDAYLHLNRLGSDQEPLPGRMRSS